MGTQQHATQENISRANRQEEKSERSARQRGQHSGNMLAQIENDSSSEITSPSFSTLSINNSQEKEYLAINNHRDRRGRKKEESGSR